MDRAELLAKILGSEIEELVRAELEKITLEFNSLAVSIPPQVQMGRRELYFHDQIRLLGQIALAEGSHVTGDFLEIGVWKGRTLALLQRLLPAERKLFGIDPLELPNQVNEIAHYRESLFSNAILIRDYSEHASAKLRALTDAIFLLHIDGGHRAENVFLDFLIYSKFVVPGGYVVFDDYNDSVFSPDVGPAVDALRALNFFNGFDIFGPVGIFSNSYILRKKNI
jgi:hypothetical protein